MITLLDLFKTFSGRDKKTAFVYRTGIRRFVISYGSLYKSALQTASWLKEQGVGPGDRVVIWAPNSPWWVIAFWGTIIRGAIIVPVDFFSGKDRAEKIAKLTESKVIIQSQYKLEKIESANSIFIEDLQYKIANLDPAVLPTSAEENGVVELIYTSGTTGDPKGVQLTNKNLISNLLAVNRHIPVLNDSYSFLSLLPLSHMFEQMGGLLTPLFKGGSIVYISTLKPSAIMAALAEEYIYTIMIVPRLLQALKNSIERGLQSKKIAKLFPGVVKFGVHRKFGKNFKFFISGGSALGLDIGKFWQNLGFVVIEGYGLTECSPILSGNLYERQKLGSVGKVLPGVNIKIEQGEILAKGESIFPGYWRNEKATQEAFTADGWFKTGDLGEEDNEGWLYIKGRKKDLIVTGAGVNIYPEDVENVLNKILGVREACVIGKKGPEGEEVHAVLILDESLRKPAEIIGEANEQLDTLQQIQGFSIWPEPEFPKTTTLKIQKFKVKEFVAKGQMEVVSESKDKLISLISKVTGKSSASINPDSLLAKDLGLTSVARLELVNYIEQEFRLDLDDSLIDQKTTVESLRKIITSKEKSPNRNSFPYWPNTKFGRLVRKVSGNIINFPIFFFFVKLEKRGLENLELINGPVIFIANHISYLDHPAIAFSLPGHIRYSTATAAKGEFFQEDIKTHKLKWLWKRFTYYYALITLNLFPLPRVQGFRETLKFMGKLIDHKVNIIIFPEGARSYDGKILPFMDGLGIIVKELQVPVVPIRIEGIEKVLPRGSAMPKRGKVAVIFGRPQNLAQETPAKILEISKNLIINL